MITRRDLEIAEQCTAGGDCEVHPIGGRAHVAWSHVDVVTELREWADVSEALERAMSETWDADSSMGEIAGRWIEHMATTHGAHCAGPHCEATADTPAYVAVLRRMWRGALDDTYRMAISDLAYELGVDLDG